MIILLSIFTLITSCEKEGSSKNFLPGSWELNKTELYVNGILNGSSEYEETTTNYEFGQCNTSNNYCEVIISEDGEITTYKYTYQQDQGLITLDSNNTYQVQSITKTKLILSKEYGLNKSIWSFNKDQ